MNHPTEAATEAAIRLADGKVFVGNFHGHALEVAAEAGYADADLAQAELGFADASCVAFELAGGSFTLDCA